MVGMLISGLVGAANLDTSLKEVRAEPNSRLIATNELTTPRSNICLVWSELICKAAFMFFFCIFFDLKCSQIQPIAKTTDPAISPKDGPRE